MFILYRIKSKGESVRERERRKVNVLTRETKGSALLIAATHMSVSVNNFPCWEFSSVAGKTFLCRENCCNLLFLLVKFFRCGVQHLFSCRVGAWRPENPLVNNTFLLIKIVFVQAINNAPAYTHTHADKRGQDKGNRGNFGARVSQTSFVVHSLGVELDPI